MVTRRFIALYSRDGFKDTAAQEKWVELAHQLSPRVELWSPCGLVLEIPSRYEQETLQQLSRLRGPSFDFGVASTRMAAFWAARFAPGTSIPPGKERDFLGGAQIELLILGLPLHPKIKSSICALLARWGIRTLGEAAALPEAELVARLGQEAVLLQKMARGEDLFPFQACRPALRFEVSEELEWTLDSLEPLAFILGRLLERLCADLQSHGLATDFLQVLFKLDNHCSHERTLKLAFPTHNPKLLLSLLRLELQSHPPQAGIVAVTLGAEPARPRVFQYSLLQPATLHPEKWSRTLAQLTALVGKGNVGFPVILNTHRPDAVRMDQVTVHSTRVTGQSTGDRSQGSEDRRQESGITQASHPSRARQQAAQSSDPCRVTSDSQRPAVSGLSLRRFRPPLPFRVGAHQITTRAGPWRSSGDWWAEGWSRDEWDMQLADGTLCRVYWDYRQNAWFLEATYD